MNIFLIIVGAIFLLICGPVYLSTYIATKNQTNWDKFYKLIEEKNLSATEEIIYNFVCKMGFWFGSGSILGGLLLICGIILQIALK